MGRAVLLHSAEGIVATCEPTVRVLRGAAILIRDGCIVELGNSDVMQERYAGYPTPEPHPERESPEGEGKGEEERREERESPEGERNGAQGSEEERNKPELVDLTGRWIIPGLINTHVHTSQQLGRGIADDVDLLTWLHHRIWPYESAMTYEDSYVSTLLCCTELIRSGVTCFAEAGGQHVGAMARAVEEAGLRACLCRSTMDSGEGLPAAWAATSTGREIAEQEALHKQLHGSAGGRVRIWLGLRQILNATDELLTKTAEAAERLNTGIHMHVAEIPFETAHVAATRGVPEGQGTVTHLGQIGCLSRRLLAAHSVWVSPEEVGLMAEHRVSAVHCPAAAMRMLGFSPVAAMLQAGVNVSLGTDGAPSNNRMSMVDEMYLAALVNKGKLAYEAGATDPTALPAAAVLRMATINGARSVLWEDEIGSLEVGKKADLVVVNPRNFAMTPLHNAVSALVYSMRTENIESVMCNGKWLMKDRIIITIDEDALLEKAQVASRNLLQRAGISLDVNVEFVNV